MYIVKRGTLEMLSETGQVINRLKEGASFGELAILKLSGGKNANRRNRSLRSVGYSDVYVLKREDVLSVLQDYPEQRNKLIEKGIVLECSHTINLTNTHFKAKQMIRQQEQADQELSGIDNLGDLHDISGIRNTDETIVNVAKTLSMIETEIANMYKEFEVCS